MTFKRTKENFTCEHCGKKVKGNGYTNHCPYCLWSKHVDNNPGDRASDCHGLMQPLDYELDRDQYTLVFKCEKCGHLKKNKAVPEDNFEEILALAQRVAKSKTF